MPLHLSRERTGFILVLVSAFAFSAKTVLAKMCYQYGVDALTVLALRLGSAGIIFAVIFGFNLARRRWTLNLTGRQWLWVWILGLFGYYLSAFLDFAGLVYVDASLGRMILFLYPTLVVIINAVLNRQPIRGGTWLALGLCYGGIFLMILPRLGGAQTNVWLGSALIFGAAMTYAGYLAGTERLLTAVDPGLFTSLVMGVSTLGLIAHFLLARDVADLLRLPAPVLVNGLFMGIFTAVLPVYALTAGLTRIGASRAAMISMFGPVLTMIMGAALLDERLAAIQAVGMLLVMAGVWRVGK